MNERKCLLLRANCGKIFLTLNMDLHQYYDWFVEKLIFN